MPSHVPEYGNLFKFGKNDVLVNTIKAHPKTTFFIYTSSIYYNNTDQEFENSNTPNGCANLYDLNVNRPSDQLIFPFITKRGNFTSFNTISLTDYTLNNDMGDVIQGSYVITSSIHSDLFAASFAGRKKTILYGLQNSLNYYTGLSPHFQYSYEDRTINSLESNVIKLIQIPSIFYGSSIKKGSIKLKYYITGTLIAEASDINRNGEIIQTTGTLANQVVGVAMYNEGFLVLTSSADLKGPSGSVNRDKYGADAGASFVTPSWQYFATTNAHSRAPSSSFSIEFNGVNYVNTITMFAHAKENQLNFSNNPTYITGNLYALSGSSFYAQNDTAGIKNIVSSSYKGYSASFKPTTYISKVGVYDENRNLIAIASLANPVKKLEERSYTFKLKLDI